MKLPSVEFFNSIKKFMKKWQHIIQEHLFHFIGNARQGKQYAFLIFKN